VQQVAEIDREVEGRIVMRALSALHPVHDGRTVDVRCSTSTNRDAGVRCESLECHTR
jgi:hypothetical protein